MILLDTNVLSEWMKPYPEPAVIAWLDQQREPMLFMPAIAKLEIESGIAMLPEGKRKRSLAVAAELIFDAFSERCLPLDCAAAAHYAQIILCSKVSGRPVSVEDAQIAAIAVANGLVLATRNV